MGSWLLPILANVPDQRFACKLEGETFTFRFRWNERMGDVGMWMMDLSDGAGDILTGEAVPLGLPLFHLRFSDARLPPGDAKAIDTSGQNMEPGVADLGGRVQIVYIDSTGP